MKVVKQQRLLIKVLWDINELIKNRVAKKIYFCVIFTNVNKKYSSSQKLNASLQRVKGGSLAHHCFCRYNE